MNTLAEHMNTLSKLPYFLTKFQDPALCFLIQDKGSH